MKFDLSNSPVVGSLLNEAELLAQDLYYQPAASDELAH